MTVSGERFMKNHIEMAESYEGFELGPIRPPSEAASLMLRVTRNCPWNKCKFCGLYRGEKFSIRPVEHVMWDIDLIRLYVDQIEEAMQQPGDVGYRQLSSLQLGLSYPEQMAFHSALNWVRSGMRSVFLQDANTLVIKPARTDRRSGASAPGFSPGRASHFLCPFTLDRKDQ